ncbi:MAG: Ig-like domain-containing protein, partial [Myxococcota bacterium]
MQRFRRFLAAFLALAVVGACSSSSDDFGGDSSPTPRVGRDTLAPVISISQPGPNQTLPAGVITLTGLAADDVGVDRVEVFVRDGEAGLATGLDNWSYQTESLAAGTYEFTARATDAAGNVGEATVTVILDSDAEDNEPPVVTVVSPAEGATLGAGPIVVEGTASDNVSVEAVFAKLNLSGANVAATGTNSWRVELDGQDLASGENLIVVSARDTSGNSSDAAVRSIFIDRTLPVASVLTGPPRLTTSRTASFTIGGNNVVSYSFSLDGGAFSGGLPISTPLEFSDLRDGEHVLELIGISIEGEEQVSPTSYLWVVDTTAPVATVSAPESPTRNTSVSVTVGGEGVENYRYRLDGAAYSASTSVVVPISEVGLSEGAHTLEVLASDSLGNEQTIPTRVTWLIDLTPPDDTVTEVTGAPGTVTVDDGVEIMIGGPDIVGYFYELDDDPRQGQFPISTPLVLTELAPGPHVLRIFGVDSAGNIQSPPTIINWTIDPDAIVAIVSAPPSITNLDPVVLSVSGDGVASYRYSLESPDGETQGFGPFPVSTPLSVDTSASVPAEGLYTVAVIGIDGVGAEQPTPTEVSFVVDRTAPVAVLGNLPQSTTNQTFLNASVGGTDVVRYRCRLDGGALEGPFDTSTPIAVDDLPDGAHTVDVFGSDVAGNEQASPTSYTWSVDTGNVTAVLSNLPAEFTAETSAQITVSGTGVETYRYRLDSGAPVGDFPVAQAIELSGLSDGFHSLEVFGISGLGTVQSFPTTHTWTVDTSEPVAVLRDPPPATTSDSEFSLAVEGA